MTSRTSSRRRLGSFITRAAAAGALILGTVGLAAAPAQADGPINLTINGTTSAAAGSTVNLTVTGSIEEGTVLLLDQNGQQQGQTFNYGLGASQANFSFAMPNSPSPLTLTAINYDTGGSSVGFSNPFSITLANGVTTNTYISAPNTAKVGTATKITVNVRSTNSSYAPTGQVVVRDQNGNTVTTMGLTRNGNSSSYAYWWWTPPAAGTYIFTAYYNGDGTAIGSTSAADAVNASGSGSTITLTAPGTMSVGVPVTLTATLVPNTIQGSVGFTFNGQPISGSVPIVGGKASIQWTPTVPGNATLGANFMTNGGLSGSTTDPVVIVAAPVQADRITLVQPGFGPWQPNATYPMMNGSSFAFQASTASGAGVTLTETGPCIVNGLTLTVPTGTGQCNLVASSPGGNGFGPVQYGYTVTLIPGNQTANVAAPQSGNYKAGRTLTLEGPGNDDTNAGQNITWTISKGKNTICKLKFNGNGAVKLKLLKKGHCMVKAKAPGVAGQWNPYYLKRSYHAK